MAKRNYKKDEAIPFVYQAPGSLTGITDVTATFYDEAGVLDGVNFPDLVLTEVGTTGKYRGTFTPDAEGEWEVHIAYNSKTLGKVVQQFSVGNFNLNEVGSDVVVIKAAVASLDSPPMLG